MAMASAPPPSSDVTGIALSQPHLDLLEGLDSTIYGLISTFSDGGFSIWIVGGAVRDTIAGIPLHDIDFATNATPTQVVEMIPSAIPTGLAFGTVTIPLQKGVGKIEITTLRKDGTYLDGRRPESVRFGTSLAEDLLRRDFTVNAMAIDPVHGLFYDPHEGVKDLFSGKLSAVGNPNERLQEDGLRIMRAYRFMGHPSGPFVPDKDLSDALVDCVDCLSPVARERIWVEFSKILSFPKVFDVLQRMVDDGAMEYVSPSVSKISDVDACFFDDVNQNSLMIGRLSLLLQQLDDDGTREILDGLRVSNKVRDTVLQIKERIGILPNPESKGCLRRYRMALGEDLESQLSADRGFNQAATDDLRAALDILPHLQGGTAPLVDGDEILLRLGITPGPSLGSIKKWLFRIQVEYDLIDSEAVWAKAESLGFNGEPVGEFEMWV